MNVVSLDPPVAGAVAMLLWMSSLICLCAWVAAVEITSRIRENYSLLSQRLIFRIFFFGS